MVMIMIMIDNNINNGINNNDDIPNFDGLQYGNE